jgi:ribose/xylose/arabinose/galactoside ABC-type transport system permease subunit
LSYFSWMNLRVLKRNIPFAATASVCVLLYVVAAIRFRDANFFSLRVFIDFFNDNSFLGIAAIGMTFVILSGGIDLSVGGVVGLVSVVMALMIEKHHAHPAIAIPLVLILGAGLGAAMGCLIQYFALPPFLVTLAGMFFARGLALVLQLEAIPITHYLDAITSHLRIPLGPGLRLPATAILYFIAFILALWLAHFTKFGRNIYAIGGNEQSSTLMGLPVARTKVGVYALSGLCSAMAGVVFTLYTSSGNPNAGMGMELDAIAAAVIGGTLLSGGIGYLAGTFVGVLIFGIIQTAINFGNFNSYIAKVVLGGLLLLFILLQKLIQAKKA